MNNADLEGKTISTGTLRHQDLIQKFIWLAELVDHDMTTPVWNEWKHIIDATYEDDFEESEESSYLLEDLFDLLNTMAPEGTYFGSHEGDGACFGFWTYTEEMC